MIKYLIFMISNNEKENIIQLLYSNNDKMISLYSITNYFSEIAKDLFSKNDNKSEFISLDLLKSYFNLPYYLTKLIYSNIFKANETEQINLKSFVDGMINLYFVPIHEKIKIFFDFFDTLNIGKIYTNDIVLILKHFHLLTGNNNFIVFEQFIKYSFQYYLNRELTYDKWEQLINENSDIFILIIYFFEHFKPFSLENINSLLKINFGERRYSMNISNFDINYKNSNNYSKISDCSNVLFDYLNKVFNLNLEYKENDDDEIELEHLNQFESDKSKKFYDLYEEVDDKMFYLNKKISINKPFSCKEIFIRREKKKKFASAIINETNSMNLKNTRIYKKLNINLPSDFNEATKLECFLLENENKIYYNIYIINNDLFVFRLKNSDDKNGYFDSLISLMNTIPVLDKDFLNSNYIHVLKLYSNSLRYFARNSNKNIIPFKRFYCENQSQVENFINEIKNIFNFGKKFSNFYKTEEDIIEGSSGKYYKCINKKNSNYYIVKIIKRKKINKNNLKYIRNEMDIFEFLQNTGEDNLIKTYEKYEENSHLFFIYELPNEGQLIEQISKVNNNKISSIQNYLINIIKSLSYLHSFGFIYDDILLNNIYIYKYDNCCIAKLVIYEEIKLLYSKERIKASNENRNNNPNFPIEISSLKHYNNLVDSWQIGLLIYYLLFQNYPFQIDKKTNMIDYELDIPENLHFEISKNEVEIYHKFNNLINLCFEIKFEKRPSMNEILLYLLEK